MIQRSTVWRLALVAGLALWLCVAYWLYATRIYPRLHGTQEMSGPRIIDTLDYPVAFQWADDEPLFGRTFPETRRQLGSLAQDDLIALVEGSYYLDEASTPEDRVALARRRIEEALAWMPAAGDRLLLVIRQAPIKADVRSRPFEGVRFQFFPIREWLAEGDSLLSVCYPGRREPVLPAIVERRMETWGYAWRDETDLRLVITGRVDTANVSIPADLVRARSLYIADVLARSGWTAERLAIRTVMAASNDTLADPCLTVRVER